MSFDNSIRGLPFKPRAISKDEIESLRQRHVWTSPPTLETVEMVFITADVMDDFISYGAFAWDVNDNLFLIEAGEVPYLELTDEKRETVNEQLKLEGKPPVNTLEDVLNKDYLQNAEGVGIKATFLVVDQGGHKLEEVKHFASAHINVLMQKRNFNEHIELEAKRQPAEADIDKRKILAFNVHILSIFTEERPRELPVLLSRDNGRTAC